MMKDTIAFEYASTNDQLFIKVSAQNDIVDSMVT